MPFSTLETALDAIQTACMVDTSIKFGPTKPPEQANDFPFVVTYPTTFTHKQGPMAMITYLYDVVVELHIARSDLPNDIDLALPYAESIPNAVYDCLNDNTAAQGEGSGRFGALEWGLDPDTGKSIPTIGFSWTFAQVKIQKSLT